MIIIYIFLFIFLILIFLIWYVEGYRYLNINQNEFSDLVHLDRKYKYVPKVKTSYKTIISLTTIPDRIDKLIPTLSSIYLQSVRVDEIRLNIPWVSRKGIMYVIPKYLQKCKYINIVRVEEDLGPSTKLLPTAKDEERNTRIIVIDDDQIYGSKMIERMMEMFERKGGKIAVTNYGANFRESSWDRINGYAFGNRYVDTLFGCGGYIVTPKMLPKDIYDYSIAPESAIFVDDNWISGWLKYNGIKIYMMGLSKGTCFFLSQSTLSTETLSGGPNKNHQHEKIVNKWFRELYLRQF
jgi:hypothetical protein